MNILINSPHPNCIYDWKYQTEPKKGGFPSLPPGNGDAFLATAHVRSTNRIKEMGDCKSRHRHTECTVSVLPSTVPKHPSHSDALCRIQIRCLKLYSLPWKSTSVFHVDPPSKPGGIIFIWLHFLEYVISLQKHSKFLEFHAFNLKVSHYIAFSVVAVWKWATNEYDYLK